jgi:FixJ family two-component response regulator
MHPTEHPHQVYIIDDDESVRRALCRMLRSAGMAASAYATVDGFIADCVCAGSACVIADVRIPGSGGLDLPAALHRIGCDLPVIIVTAQDSDAARAEAKRAGAAAFFRKPVDDQALLDAIEWATQGEQGPLGGRRVTA